MHQNQLMLKSTEVTRWLWTRTVGYTKGHFPALTSWPKENRLTSEHRQYISFNTFKIRFILQSIIVLDCNLTISSTQVRAVLHDTCGDAPDLWRQTRPGVWWTQSAIKTRGGKGSQRVSIFGTTQWWWRIHYLSRRSVLLYWGLWSTGGAADWSNAALGAAVCVVAPGRLLELTLCDTRTSDLRRARGSQWAVYGARPVR